MLSAADHSWFADRVDGLLPELYGAAVRLCRDRTDAEDLVADSVAKAWEALPTLQDPEAFRGWIFRILNNGFFSHCRSARSRAEHEPLDGTGEEFSIFERLHQPFLLWSANPEQDFLNRLLREDLDHAIASLPDVFRAVVVMVDVQGLAYRDVSEALDIPVGTVRSRLSRGRSLLQETLWEHAVEVGLRKAPPADHTEGEIDDGN